MRDKVFKIASDPKYAGHQRRLISMVYKFFDKKNQSSGSGIVNEPNYQLANELHKPIIRKIKKIKVYWFFKDNISGVDLADMQSLSKWVNISWEISNYCVIDLLSKYAWVIPIKDKKELVLSIHFKK